MVVFLRNCYITVGHHSEALSVYDIITKIDNLF